MTTVGINLDGLDFDHPAVAAALVKRKQGGFFPVDMVQKLLMDCGVPDAIIPSGPSLTTALKRAMDDACKGDTSLEVKVQGRKSTSVYTIVRTNRDRLDREVDDGKGVSDAELTGRIEFDGNGNYSVKFTPADHPSIPFIRKRMDDHTGQLSNVYDLGVWFGQVFMPYVGALPTGQGDYFLPKGDKLDMVKRVKEAFAAVNNGSNHVMVYMLPQIGGVVDTIDAITDCLLDEVERVCTDIEGRLSDTDKPIRQRGLEGLNRKAIDLREMLAKFSESLNASFEDITPRITDVEARIGMASVALDAK